MFLPYDVLSRLKMLFRNKAWIFFTFAFPLIFSPDILEGSNEVMAATPHDVATASISYLDFLLPGIIGMSIMSSSLMSTVGLSASNRARGAFRKLATTPISSVEWNAAKILYQATLKWKDD